ncbi:MAG: hypothetical protein LBG15_09545 [Dysgonamonadaceae bacterium]|jgi:hypothetical protein|nr:hypothetical protein [Dysgonamonadaceae bacterium]
MPVCTGVEILNPCSFKKKVRGELGAIRFNTGTTDACQESSKPSIPLKNEMPVELKSKKLSSKVL